MTLASSSPIVHHPFQFGLGPLTLTGFGIAEQLACLIAQLVSERELARRHHDIEAAAVSDVLFAALVGTMIGAKLYFILIVTHDWHDLFSRGGFVFWGGFIGAVVCCALVIRHKKLSFPRFADVAGLAIAAGYSVGRTGCWAVGDDYGKPYSGPLAVAFPQGSPPSTVASMSQVFHVQFPPTMNPAQVVSVVPTQLIEVVLGFVMFAILWRMRDHDHAEGWLFGVWCVFAGIERFIIEFFRAKDDRFPIFLSLSTAQVIALGIMLAGFAIMRARAATGPDRPPVRSTPILTGG